MYTYTEEGNIVRVSLKSYNGDIAEHSVVKETGFKVRPCNTASNQINVFPATPLSTPFIDEQTGTVYCDVRAQNRDVVLPVCGEMAPDAKRIFVVETFDLDEKTRWIVMENVPVDVRRHFINIDIMDGDKIVRRLRMDPFFGGAKVV